jgi:hypothetical protein
MKTSTTTTRPDGRGDRSLWLATVFRGRDFWTAVVVFVASLVVGLNPTWLPGLNLSETPSLWYLTTPLVGFSVGGAALGRYVEGQIRGTDYEQLVGAVDPTMAAVSQPYSVVSLVALAGAVLSGLTTWLAPVSPEWLRVTLYASTLALAVWAVVGTVGLVFITHHHTTTRAEVASLRRQVEREQRQARRGDSGSPDS